MAGWIVRARRSGFFGGEPPVRAMRRYAARVGVVAVSVVIFLPSAFAYYTLVTPTPIPAIELPEPNGYDDLIRALVQENAPVLEIARMGLDRECVVPVQYDSGEYLGTRPNTQSLRRLARAFDAKARMAVETEDAMRIHCDNLRLGNAAGRGGLLLDRLIGLAIKRTGFEGLNGLSDGLSPQQCRELIAILETSQSGQEPFEDYRIREKAREDHAFGWRGRVWKMACLLRHMPYSASEWEKRAAERLNNADLHNEAQKRLLIGKLAIRCYQIERGELPGNLADLVPEYLPAVPQDPLSEGPLIYRQTGDGYLLYSVGRDRVDDGGHRVDPKDESADDKDILLNTTADDG